MRLRCRIREGRRGLRRIPVRVGVRSRPGCELRDAVVDARSSTFDVVVMGRGSMKSMRLLLPICLLTACAGTTERDRSVVVAFPADRIDLVESQAVGERWCAQRELFQTGYCALVKDWPVAFDDLKRWTDATGLPVEEAKPNTPAPARSSSDWLSPAPRASGWNLDIYGVTIARLEDRPALRVETRLGDWGGMDRVVAWLEACGGKRVR